MNNTALNQTEQQFQHQCQIIAELNVMHQRQILNYSKAFLDKVFPLDQGSHNDVCSYVVYYQHLLAFFPTAATVDCAILPSLLPLAAPKKNHKACC